ncbi:MAG: DUF885 domain-containing protein [Candidatus Zixiibacteriota bacterium]
MRRCGVLLLIGLFVLTAGASGQSKAEENLYKLGAEILKDLQQYHPVHATELGIHEYDGYYTDYSAKEVQKEKKRLRDFLARLHKYNGTKMSVDARIDHKLLVGNCETAVLRLWGIRNQDKNPNVYIDEAVGGIYAILLSDYAPMSRRLDDIIGRMKRLPAFLAQGQDNVKNTPPIWLDYARQNIDNAISFFESTRDQFMRDFPERAGEISEASDGALAALNSFKRFLEQTTPGAAGSFSIGSEHFNHLLESEHMLNFDADSLLRIGEAMIAKTKAEYAAAKERFESVGMPKSVPPYVPATFARQDVFDYYQWEINAVKDFIAEKELLTIPANIGDCVPIETPEFLRGVIGGIAYQPSGPFDAATTGYFYVPPISEEDFEKNQQSYFSKIAKRDFRGSVVHEAFPGHHLQFQIAAQHPSEIRRWQTNNSLVEGWALYCEELMYREGLYADEPEKELNVLKGILFRAVRIVVDVKLHTGQMTYDQGVEYMMDTIELEEWARPYITKEVLRYTMDPTQPMSYLVGKLAIEKLKQDVMAREGVAFSLKSFHDRLLAEGSLPPSLIRRKLLQ